MKYKSALSGLNFIMTPIWLGKQGADDYLLGPNWYTNRTDPELFDGKWQGGKTILKYRSEILLDWAERWDWLQE